MNKLLSPFVACDRQFKSADRLGQQFLAARISQTDGACNLASGRAKDADSYLSLPERVKRRVVRVQRNDEARMRCRTANPRLRLPYLQSNDAIGGCLVVSSGLNRKGVPSSRKRGKFDEHGRTDSPNIDERFNSVIEAQT